MNSAYGRNKITIVRHGKDAVSGPISVWGVGYKKNKDRA
jgi:hypothetical protein